MPFDLCICVLAAVVGGTSPADQIIVSGYTSGGHRFEAADGTTLPRLESSSGLSGALGMDIGPDGLLYVASELNDSVKRFDPESGAFVDDFIPAGAGGLTEPAAVVFGPDRTGDGVEELYVSSFDGDSVLVFNGASGAFLQTFVSSGSGGLDGPDAGMAFGPDGNLYVPSFWNHRILRYDGTTGAFIDTFVPTGSGSINWPRTVRFRPSDGNMLVSCERSNRVNVYDAQTGGFIQPLITGISGPTGMDFSSDGSVLFLATINLHEVRRYDANTGAFIDTLVPSHSDGLNLPTFLLRTRQNDVQLNAAEVVTGTLLEGDVDALRHSDDAYLRIRSGFGSTLTDLHHTEVEVRATVLDAPVSTLDLTVESAVDQPTAQILVRALNLNTNVFETVGTSTVGDADSTLRVEGLNAGDYIGNDGEIVLRVKHVVHVPFLAFQFRTRIDMLDVDGR